MILTTPPEKTELGKVLPPLPVESSTSPGCSHRCAHCDSEKGVPTDTKPSRTYSRLICGALWFSLTILVLALAEVIVETLVSSLDIDTTEIAQCTVAYYSFGTLVTLALLLRQERRRENTQTRTTSQVCVLCGLGLAWLGFSVGLVVENVTACQDAFFFYGNPQVAVCALFTVVDIFSWILFFALFGAAFALYHRSLNVHRQAERPAPGHPTLSGT
ncbi:hypothetical protein DFH08DRAFT_883516 [Mycena albidolilacea]|uniref:Uncharacterized protein n=1 Tax=Mycena albidolilacea TaxID=1033008 RepID=A0AAD7EJL9_9AGAR|nr:hypothetical protein DFH08DRAFT_883516 [Mycena albidolilacea]